MIARPPPISLGQLALKDPEAAARMEAALLRAGLLTAPRARDEGALHCGHPRDCAYEVEPAKPRIFGRDAVEGVVVCSECDKVEVKGEVKGG